MKGKEIDFGRRMVSKSNFKNVTDEQYKHNIENGYDIPLRGKYISGELN